MAAQMHWLGAGKPFEKCLERQDAAGGTLPILLQLDRGAMFRGDVVKLNPEYGGEARTHRGFVEIAVKFLPRFVSCRLGELVAVMATEGVIFASSVVAGQQRQTPNHHASGHTTSTKRLGAAAKR